MIISRKYDILYYKNYYYIINHDPAICPFCKEALKVYDSHPRKMIIENGQALTFRLRRLICPSCGTLHLELPDIMEKNKHYAKHVIIKALSSIYSDCPADNATIIRWKKEYPNGQGTIP